MLLGTQQVEADDIALGDLRQQLVAVVDGRIVPAFLVHSDEPRFDEHRTVRTEPVAVLLLARGEIDSDRVEYRRHHLAGHRALPDQGIEPELVFLEHALEVVGVAGNRRRTDGLVRLLRVPGLGLENSCFVRHVPWAVTLRDDLADFVERDCRQRHGVGTHVGDQADVAFAGEFDAFIKTLGRAHRALRIETELARSFLLQRRSRERRRRITPTLLLRNGQRRQLAACGVKDGSLDIAGRAFVLEAELLYLVTFVGNQAGYERLLVLADVGLDRPVLAGLERFDLELAFDDHAECRALYAAGRKTGLDLLPEQRRKVETDEIIQRASRLLCADEIIGDIARMVDGFLHRMLRNLVKHDPVHRFGVQRILFPEQFDQVPGNGFALAIRVGREIQRVRLLQRTDDRIHVFFIALDDLVLHRETTVGIDGAFFGDEVANMAIRSHHLEIFSEIFADGLRLGWRFNDDQILGHRMKNRGQCRG